MSVSVVAGKKGFAAMEAAVWSTVLLPVALFAASLYALSHDQNVVQIIPETLQRETIGEVLTWVSDGSVGTFSVDYTRLEEAINKLADRGLAEIGRNSFKLGELSARACFWVYQVDSSSGGVGDLESTRCVDRGSLGSSLSLESSFRSRISMGISMPTQVPGGEDFLDRVVLLGVGVGGLFDGITLLTESQFVGHSAVWVPRKEVFL